MTISVNDTKDFNVCMNLNIDWELEYIALTVITRNKRTHKTDLKYFPAAEFDKALAYYKKQERMFCE